MTYGLVSTYHEFVFLRRVHNEIGGIGIQSINHRSYAIAANLGSTAVYARDQLDMARTTLTANVYLSLQFGWLVLAFRQCFKEMNREASEHGICVVLHLGSLYGVPAVAIRPGKRASETKHFSILWHAHLQDTDCFSEGFCPIKLWLLADLADRIDQLTIMDPSDPIPTQVPSKMRQNAPGTLPRLHSTEVIDVESTVCSCKGFLTLMSCDIFSNLVLAAIPEGI